STDANTAVATMASSSATPFGGRLTDSAPRRCSQQSRRTTHRSPSPSPVPARQRSSQGKSSLVQSRRRDAAASRLLRAPGSLQRGHLRGLGLPQVRPEARGPREARRESLLSDAVASSWIHRIDRLQKSTRDEPDYAGKDN